jgi:hypothetical protein
LAFAQSEFPEKWPQLIEVSFFFKTQGFGAKFEQFIARSHSYRAISRANYKND